MRLSHSCCLALGLLVGLGLQAQEPRETPEFRHFLTAQTVHLDTLLPPPPAPGSPAALADLLAVQQVQAWRTPEQVQLAQAVETGTLWDYRCVVGPWLQEAQLPVCAAFFKKVQQDTWAASQKTKAMYQRPRPFQLDPTLEPCVKRPTSGSYPSGHSLQLYVWAGILEDLVPEQAQALQREAGRRCWARVLGGVHYPSDLTASKVMAQALLKVFRASKDYQEGLAACRREIAAVTLKKAS